MANIILDEKRAVRIGEVCAINLKEIRYVKLLLWDKPDDYYDDIVKFYSTGGSASSDDEITLIKYVGNGMFMDLVSDQLIMTEVFNSDDFGTDELNALDKSSIAEIDKMVDFWRSIYNPKNKLEFSESFSIFMQNPLLIDITCTPFMSLNAENTKKFASQSLEQLRSKIMSAKAMAQQGLKQKYSQYERQIAEHYSSIENKSSPKTM